MKKSFTSIAIAAALCIPMLSPVSAKTSKKKTRSYSNANIVLKANKTVKKYNLDHKGKTDSLTVYCGTPKNDDYSNKSITVKTNGKSLTVKPSDGYYTSNIRLLRMKNGRYLVYVCVSGDDDLGDGFIFDVSGKKPVLKMRSNTIANINYGTSYGFDSPKVKGNTLSFEYLYNTATIGFINAKLNYTVSPSGTLKGNSKWALKKTVLMKGKFKLRKNIQTYKYAGSSRKAYLLKKGTYAKVTAVKISKKVPYFWLEEGKKKGYIKGLKHSQLVWKSDFDGNPYFDNVMYVG